MLLTIGMIVKNEEKYLEECLTALKPILDNVDSELIIADTGSTDRTVEIAKKFTDNVFHFEWINDFAAARNSTLDKAQGEWYMFIDADEILVDPTEIIEFFNSGEYKNYGSATYIQKNYNDLSNRGLFNCYHLHRLTALINGVRFAKPIHENFDKYFTPVKHFNVTVDHYGYVIRDNGKPLELIEKKTSRNLELLFKELEDGKKTGNIKDTVFGQIADCYQMLGKAEEALDYIEQGMEHCRKDSLVLIEYYIKKNKALHKLDRYEDVIKNCEQYFSKENLARTGRFVTDSTFYFYWATASYILNNYDDAINKAILGFDIYRSYRNGKLFTPELGYCGVETNIPILKQMCNMLIVACVKQERYNDAIRQLPSIPLEDFFSDTEFMKSHLDIRTLLMDKTNYNTLQDLYYSLDKPNRELYINILVRHIFKAKKKEQFLKKFSALSKENDRLAALIKLYESHFINHTLYPTQTAEFIKKYGTKNNESVWILMMKNHFDITPFICAEDFDISKSVEDVYIDVQYADDTMDLFENSLYTLSEDGVEKAMDVLCRSVDFATEKRFDTTKIIRSFVNLGKRWKELNPDKEMPENVAFALTLEDISILHRKKKYDESMERIKNLIGETAENNTEQSSENSSEELLEGFSEIEQKNAFEPIAENTSEQPNENLSEEKNKNVKTKILRHYLVVIKLDKKNNTEMMEKHNDNPMAVEIANQIKQEIRVMIDNWDLDGAEAALNQIARMAPFDADIEDIRDEITDRKINYMNYM